MTRSSSSLPFRALHSTVWIIIPPQIGTMQIIWASMGLSYRTTGWDWYLPIWPSRIMTGSYNNVEKNVLKHCNINLNYCDPFSLILHITISIDFRVRKEKGTWWRQDTDTDEVLAQLVLLLLTRAFLWCECHTWFRQVGLPSLDGLAVERREPGHAWEQCAKERVLFWLDGQSPQTLRLISCWCSWERRGAVPIYWEVLQGEARQS